MHEKKKYILLACLFGLFLFCAGTACGYFITRGSTEDYERASEYEAISADIEGSTQQLSEGIDKSLVGVQYARDAIERSGKKNKILGWVGGVLVTGLGVSVLVLALQ